MRDHHRTIEISRNTLRFFRGYVAASALYEAPPMTSSWMLAAGAPFAMVGTLAKMLGSQFSSAELAMYRSLIGLVAIGAFLLWRRETVRTPFLRSHPWRGATGTISLVASFYAMTRAYHSGSTVVVGAFAYSTVIFAAIIDALINAFTNESPC